MRILRVIHAGGRPCHLAKPQHYLQHQRYWRDLWFRVKIFCLGSQRHLRRVRWSSATDV